MKLICPSCGAIGSAESWTNDSNCRETLLVITSLPAPLPKITLSYLSLFRSGKRVLGWKKALRLAQEIKELTGKGYISMRGSVDRDCLPHIWGKAMEQMIDQRLRLRLPMPNHNYLKKVAYDLADQADCQGESDQYKRARAQKQKPQPDRTEADPLLDPLEKARRAWDKKHAQPAGITNSNNLSGCIKEIK